MYTWDNLPYTRQYKPLRHQPDGGVVFGVAKAVEGDKDLMSKRDCK